MYRSSNAETIVERTFFLSRWLLAVFYFGLIISLFGYSIHFFQEVLQTFWSVFSKEVESNDIILKMLVFVDKTLVASLIVMVMLSGFENFISHFDINSKNQHLSWLGKLDQGAVKLKLASSIVAISLIHLLKVYLDIEHVKDQSYIAWKVLIVVVFMLAALVLGWLSKNNKKE